MRQKGGGTCESSTQLVCNDNEGLWVRIEIHWTPWLIIRRQQLLLRRHDDHQKCNPTLLSRVPFSLKPELPMLLHYCHVLSSEVRLFFFHKRCQCPSMMPLKSAGDLNGNLSLKPELSHHSPTTISVKSSDAVKLVLCAALFATWHFQYMQGSMLHTSNRCCTFASLKNCRRLWQNFSVCIYCIYAFKTLL